MSLRDTYDQSTAYEQTDISGYSHPPQVNPYIPQSTDLDPQNVINQYYRMLERSGVPIIWEVRKNPASVSASDNEEVEPNSESEPLLNQPLAVYTSFVFPPMQTGEVGFKPQITVYDEEERSLMAKKLSEVHEAMHSSQFNHSAVLHAVSLNARSPVVMRIREWVKMTILTEAEAYAKTTLLAWALKHTDNDIHYNQETALDPVTVEELEQKFAQGVNVHDALVELAVEGMKKWHHKSDLLKGEDVVGEQVVSFAEFYAGNAVADYNNSWRLNRKYVWDEFPYEIIRLEDNDYRSVRADFGPNIMPALVDHLDEMIGYIPEIEDKIAEYEKKLAIYYPDQLRTFGQALASMGMTPEEFIESSKMPFKRDVTKTTYYRHLAQSKSEEPVADSKSKSPCNPEFKPL